MPTIPQARLPHLPLPAINNLPHIPQIGCGGGDANCYVGKQFGNLPDLHAILHLKAAQKWMQEQMYALLKGQLPDVPRAAAYLARLATLTDELADMAATLTDAITSVVEEATSATAGVNSKIAELNSVKSGVLAIPEQARSALQHAALDEVNACIGELNQQATRLQSSITCVQQIG